MTLVLNDRGMKFLLFLMLTVTVGYQAAGQKADTAKYYFKFYDEIGPSNDFHQVDNMAEADFFRIIFPSDSAGYFAVKDFYKNGNPRFIGKTDPVQLRNAPNAISLSLEGNGVYYYPSGKKQRITHYFDNKKDGEEFLFYPDGHLYCKVKYILKKDDAEPSAVLFLDCYDASGKLICKDGNGTWITVDIEFNPLVKGPVKDGSFDGEWHGLEKRTDSITYIYKYNKGKFDSGVGYDKSGKAYPFKDDIEKAAFKDNPIVFLDELYGHLKIPKDENGKKMSLDSVQISFIVEKDGSLSTPEVLNNENDALKSALATALSKCGKWMPWKEYGVPIRAQIIMPLKKIEGDYKFLRYDENPLGF